jgi:murein DD-endopeptidase MepM/ murein hydrolase activator NlpD
VGARRKPAATAITAVLLVALTGLAGSASAATGSGGGAVAPSAPSVRDVICISDCVGLRQATVGGVVQVTGSKLGRVSKMTFAGRRKRVVAEVTSAGSTSAEAEVPAGAIDGKVRVKDNFGNSSGLSATEIDIRPRSELGSAGDLEVAEAETSPRRAYFFGVHYPHLTYVIRSDKRLNDLRIDVVGRDGAIVRSYFRDDVPANSTQRVGWNGKTSSGRPAPNGPYSFQIRAQSGARARRSSRTSAATGFKLFGYIFPERGRHDYGGAANRFGAPRSGHTHQGQDVLAACGVPLVAARGGRVKYSGYEGNAGNYIVIDGRSTGYDTAYMHLARPSRLKTGQTVRTGQRIGVVGETGDATACHLHFELWTPPGWYTGGHPIDPLPFLRRWDRYS